MIAEVAERQRGVVSLKQLLGAGLTVTAVHKRVAAGRLHRIHRGVYAVGSNVVFKKGRQLAAVLSCPMRSAASYRMAGDIHDLRLWSGRAEVTVPSAKAKPRKDLLLHRCRSWGEGDLTEVDGIPTTGVHRTIVDLCDVLRFDAMRKVVERAEILQVLDLKQLAPERWPGRRVNTLRRLLEAHQPERIRSRSELELMVLDLCEERGWTPPRLNHEVEGTEADFVWPERRLIVESDGWETHKTRTAFEDDRERSQRWEAAGWRVLRCTYRQVERRDPLLIAAVEAVVLPAPRPARLRPS